jgi:hypothetical protein
VVVAWIVAVVALGVWSVRRDRATVPEQRDIRAGVADLQRTSGVLFAAALGDGRVAVLGALDLEQGCRITPVRSGTLASRDVTLYVREGDARTVLDAVAAGLPSGYAARVADVRGGTRLGLHADAGNFIGIDGTAQASAKVLTLRVSTGCRPDNGSVDRSDPAAGAAPAVLGKVLDGLGASTGARSVQAVACPDGGVAATYFVDDVAMPRDLSGRLRKISAGAQLVRDDASAWAFGSGNESVAVVPDEQKLRISVSVGC